MVCTKTLHSKNPHIIRVFCQCILWESAHYVFAYSVNVPCENPHIIRVFCQCTLLESAHYPQILPVYVQSWGIQHCTELSETAFIQLIPILAFIKILIFILLLCKWMFSWFFCQFSLNFKSVCQCMFFDDATNILKVFFKRQVLTCRDEWIRMGFFTRDRIIPGDDLRITCTFCC